MRRTVVWNFCNKCCIVTGDLRWQEKRTGMTKAVTLIELSKMIDHFLLHPTMTEDEIVEGNDPYECGGAFLDF